MNRKTRFAFQDHLLREEYEEHDQSVPSLRGEVDLPIQPRLPTERVADLLMTGNRYETLFSSIAFARLAMRLVSSTLGPLGMSRIVIVKPGKKDESRTLLTSDSALILENMRIEPAIGRLLRDLANTQKEECGDGVKTAVILACSLLENAEELLRMGLHPSTIIEGYGLAEDKAAEILVRKMSTTIEANDDAELGNIARSLMNSRVISSSPDAIELFSDFVVRLLRAVFDIPNSTRLTSSDISAKLDNIKFVNKTGGSLADSKLILDGFLIEDREVAHPNMPPKVKSASIALIKSLEVKKPKAESHASPLEAITIEVSSQEDYNQFMQNRVKLAESMAKKIVEAGANVALVNMGIDELVEHYLMRHKVLAVKRVKSKDMEILTKLTNGTIIRNVEEISPDKLGKAECVEEVTFGEQDHCIKISGSTGVGAASLALHAPSRVLLDEAERSIKLAIRACANLAGDPHVVAGGGATEMELARILGSYALAFPSREQLAIKQYAHALEAIPKILAENSGLGALETITNLRKAHGAGLNSWGIDALHGACADMNEKRIFDALNPKISAVKRASEVAITILRISGIEKAKRHSKDIEKDRAERDESGDGDANKTSTEC
jgi:chaperonin GroEL (HSP60 family)